jgi:hypothetical protein
MGNQGVIIDTSFGTSFALCDHPGMVSGFAGEILMKFFLRMNIWGLEISLMHNSWLAETVYRTVVWQTWDTMVQSILGLIGWRQTQIFGYALIGLLLMVIL